MAEAAASGQAPPTFKLVLVGDGGTGKVGSSRDDTLKTLFRKLTSLRFRQHS